MKHRDKPETSEEHGRRPKGFKAGKEQGARSKERATKERGGQEKEEMTKTSEPLRGKTRCWLRRLLRQEPLHARLAGD